MYFDKWNAKCNIKHESQPAENMNDKWKKKMKN